MDRNADVDALNSLITTTIDSARGFERSAEDVEGGPFAQLFREFARERRQVVARLQEEVRDLGGRPNDDGSIIADVHRRWLDLRNAFSKGDQAVIQEVERGEDHIKDKYEAALENSELSERALAAIREGYESVRAGHEVASQLKHSMAASES